MIFVFSDLHLGRFPDKDQEILDDLRSCLFDSAQDESHTLTEIILLGDVFDSYMEFVGRLPDIAVKMVELIDELQSKGILVSYHVGNHDPWHKSFFYDRLEGRLYHAPQTRQIGERLVYLSHGDEADEYSVFGRFARRIMRSEWSYRLYTSVIPYKWGQQLPQFLSRKYAGLAPESATIKALHLAGLEVLNASEIDLVLFGHAHQSTTDVSVNGQYVNTGSWLLNRSYVELTEDSVRVRLFNSKTLKNQTSNSE